MVFETIVTDLLNKFLGDHVENLDRSQLKLGIWGGDVVLRNLQLKKSALDDLNLPVRVSHGFLEKLELKIPWTNLYNAPVVAVIDGLFLIAVPKSTIAYDPEKEDKLAWEAKQKEIQRAEEIHAFRTLAEQEAEVSKDSTFLEKLSFQIIKNIQIRITSVHFRYEDGVSNPLRPFSLGVTIHELSLESTGKDWVSATKPDENSMLIHKLTTLSSLTVYWTDKYESLSSLDAGKAVQILKDTITRDGHRPFPDSTVLGPITSQAKLRLNPHPEQVDNYSLPKIFLGLVIESLDIVFLRRQYQDFVFLADNMERMRRADPYRKFRPKLDAYKGQYKAWWHFAYNCILETVVRRRRNNWRWEHIRGHRQRCREYQKLYEKKLKEAGKESPSSKLKVDLENLEKQLDVFNVLRIRRQAELTVKREGTLAPPKKTGWFGGWFQNAQQPTAEQADSLASKVSKEMTAAEKAKLYEAIGYAEGDDTAANAALPHDYVAHLVEFSLENLRIYARKRRRGQEVEGLKQKEEPSKYDDVLKGTLRDVHLKITQIPAAKRSGVEATVGGLSLRGVREKKSGEHVDLLRSMRTEKTDLPEEEHEGALMWCNAEVNPRPEVDYAFHLRSRPIELYYDAPTAVALMDVFTMPKESKLAQLELAAYETMEDIRVKSVLGLQYAMEASKIVDLNVNFRGPFLIVPDGGRYTPDAKLLVFGFGDLLMKSETEKNRSRKNTMQSFIRESSSKGGFTEELLSAMRSQSYHQYKIELHHMQVVLVDPKTADWHEKVKAKETPHHVVAPLSFRVALDHCVLDNDPMLPKLAVTAVVPEIKVDLEEYQFYDMLNITYSAGASYPAAAEKEAQTDAQKKAIMAKHTKETSFKSDLDALAAVPEDEEMPPTKEEAVVKAERKRATKQLTKIDLKFEIKETKFMIRSHTPLEEKLSQIPLLHFGIVSLQADLVLKTSDIDAGLSLGGIEVNTIATTGSEELTDSGTYPNPPPVGVLPLVRTAMIAGDAEYLMTIRYSHVDKNEPDFKHLHGGIVQRVVAKFADFEVALQEMAVRKILTFSKHVQGEIEKINARFRNERKVEEEKRHGLPKRRLSGVLGDANTKILNTGDIQEMVLGGQVAAQIQSSKSCDGITYLAAYLDWRSLGLKLQWGSRRNIYKIRTIGLSSSIAVRKENVEFDAKIEDINVCESDPIGPYGTLVKSGRADAMKINVNMYDLKTDEEKYIDVSKADINVKAVFGGLDVVYVQRSFLELMEIYNEMMEAISAATDESDASAAPDGQQNQGIDMASAVAVMAPPTEGDSIARSQRVKLNISIKAPVVYVPRNIHSLEAFAGDFGEIKVINEFRLGDKRNELGQPSMYADYLIRLTNLNLSRCLLAVVPPQTEEGERRRHQKELDEELGSVQVVAKVMIFEPITVTVGCQQNLSAEWLKKAPLMEFYGHFEDIKGKFADEDYDVLMLTLSENLADAPPKSSKRQGSKGQVAKKSKSDASKERVEDYVAREVSTDSTAAPIVADDNTETVLTEKSDLISMACLLRLETISLELFMGASNLSREKADKESKIVSRAPKMSLAEMKLTGICVGARMKNDSTMQCHVRLEDCVINDSRFSRKSNPKGIMEIFRRKHARGTKEGESLKREVAGEDKLVVYDEEEEESEEEYIGDNSFNTKVELDIEDNLLVEMQNCCDPPVHSWLNLFSRCDGSDSDVEEESVKEEDEFYDAPEDESQVGEVLREQGGTNHVAAKEACELQQTEDAEPGRKTAELFRDFSKKIRACAASKDNMLDVIYRINTAKETHVKVRTAHSVIVADMKYLLALQTFFMVSEDTRKSTSNVMVRQTKKPAPAAGNQAGVKPGVMIVRLLINEPDIALVEDMEDIDTNAVILNMKLNFLASFDGDISKYQGSVSKMRMFSGVYNPTRRHETTNMILKPTGFSVIMKMVTDEEQKIDLNLGPMIFRVDPSTIALLTSLSEKVSEFKDQQALLQEQNGGADDNKEVAFREPTNVWDFADLAPTDFDFTGEDFLDEDDILGDAVYGIPVAGGRIPPLLHRIHKAADAMSLEGRSSRRSSSSTSSIKQIAEYFVLEAKKVMVTLEYGATGKPIPVIMLESGITGDASNWSSTMDASFTVSCQMASYNPAKGIWEPMLEPVESLVKDTIVRRPFEIDFLILGNYSERGDSDSGVDPEFVDSVDSGYGSFRLPSPKTTVNCVSKDVLNLTVSKTSLEVMSELSASFSDAAKLEMRKKFVPTAPYLVKNELGIDVVLELGKTKFRVVQNQRINTSRQWVLGNDTLGMDWIEGLIDPEGNFSKTASLPRYLQGVDEILKEQDLPEQRPLFITVMNQTFELPVTRSGKRFYPLGREGQGFLAEIDHEGGFRTITLRTVVEVENMFVFPMEVFYLGKTVKGTEARVPCGIVQPGEKVYLPFHAVYSPTAEIFFAAEGFKPSTTSYVWRNLQRRPEMPAMADLLCCDADPQKRPEGGEIPLYINVVGRQEDVQLGSTTLVGWGLAKKFRLQLFPTASIQNLLPIPVKIALFPSDETETPEVDIAPGAVHNLHAWVLGVSSLKVILPEYLEVRWQCKVKFDAHPRTKTPLLLTPIVHASPVLSKVVGVTLGVHTKQKVLGSKFFQLFSPFWMINETDKVLTYRGEHQLNSFYHQPRQEIPVLFAPTEQVDGLKNQWYKIRIEGSEFSKKVPLDNVGDVGLVECPGKDQVYRVGVKVAVTSFGLTRIVTMRPYYTLSNTSEDLTLVVMGGGMHSAREWTEIGPRETIGWWPVAQDMGALVLKVKGYENVSDPFPLNSCSEILLRFRNQVGGIFVEYSATDSSRSLSFSKYQPGMAPVVLLNHTADVKVRFWQKGADKSYHLLPGKKIIFSWAPKRLAAGQECEEDDEDDRMLVWEAGKTRVSDTLLQDRCGDIEVGSANAHRVMWVSFVHRSQRILLFTRNIELAQAAQVSFDLEAQDLSLNLTLTDLGLSLVDDKMRQEVMYVSISSSGITWDLQRGPGKPYKPLPASDALLIEKAYEEYIVRNATQTVDFENPSQSTSAQSRVAVAKNILVDFKRMMMAKPNPGRLKRTFHTGVWLHYSSSPHQTSVHFKLHNVQMDCQIYDCTFPVVFAPVPPPKTVGELGTKPFVEVVMRTRKTESSTVAYHCRYFKVLIQEFFVKLDHVFINGMLQVLGTSEKVAIDFDADLASAKDISLATDAETPISEDSGAEKRIYFELLHFSPIKMHLSFSLAGLGTGATTGIRSELLDLFLQSVGVTLTDVDDVVFKLAYFERQNRLITQQRLQSEVTSHYINQALRQLYVLVFGLDVLGNPFGLAMGIGKGAKDLFYEPMQGAVQGPEEFAEGLALGVKSFVGHTVGGTFGALSKVTGTVGKGLAALSMDKNYQRRRKELARRDGNVQTKMMRNLKGFGLGVMDGVTGVVLQPISGAKEEGVGGFFKGVGKGMVGLVSKPTSGVFDLASSSLDLVRRATDHQGTVTRVRPPRYLDASGTVRPYSRQSAEGNEVLKNLEKGKYSHTDNYIAHVVVDPNGRLVFLVTNRNIIMAKQSGVLGNWEVDWEHPVGDIIADPTVEPEGVKILVKRTSDSPTGVAKLFSGFRGVKATSHERPRIVKVDSKALASWLKMKIIAARHGL